MDSKSSKEISSWQYEGLYSIYSMDGSEECIGELNSGSYYAVKDEDGELMGYYCFGEAAQVPAGNAHGAYVDKSFVDIGLGMKPELCGNGRGYDFITKEKQFAKALFPDKNLRLTVADFNERAIKVYEKAGFEKVMAFNRVTDRGVTRFIVMELHNFI
jgi:RimJ/RimL family protein N-acetyltransferase